MKLARTGVIHLLFGGVVLLTLLVHAQAQQRGVGQAPTQPGQGEKEKKARRCSSGISNQSPEAAEGSAPAGAAARSAQQPDDSYCVEIKGDPAELKQCLTTVLQEKGWSPLPPELPDRLSLGRQVDPEELRKIAVTEIAGGKIQWTDGRVDASLSLKSQSKSTTEIRLFVRILGRGNAPFPVMRPSDWWPLASTGRLEEDLLAQVAASCEGKERTPTAGAAGVRKP
jgi:hypothetical protein